MEVVDSASAAARRRQRRLRSLPSPSTMPHEVRRRQGPVRRGTSSTTRHGDRSRLLQPELFALHEEEPCGARLRPQGRVQRQTVEHIVDFFRFAPMVQVLTCTFYACAFYACAFYACTFYACTFYACTFHTCTFTRLHFTRVQCTIYNLLFTFYPFLPFTFYFFPFFTFFNTSF